MARLIIEIDGGPFHLDVGEDARKQAVWEARMDCPPHPVRRRLDHPEHLLALAPPIERP